MKISVITVSYNAVDVIERTIQSVARQRYDDYEYIIVDGNSNDGTVDVIKRNTDNITKWMSEPDCGIYNAMNKAVRMACGEYCIFMNAGDMFATPLAMKAASLFLDDDFDVVTGREISTKSGKVIGYVVPPTEATLSHFYKTSISHQSSFIKRSLLLECPYDEDLRLVSDWKFWLKTIVLGGKSYRSIDVDISIFNHDGATFNSYGLGKKERLQVLEELLPVAVRMGYDRTVATNMVAKLWLRIQSKMKKIIKTAEIMKKMKTAGGYFNVMGIDGIVPVIGQLLCLFGIRCGKIMKQNSIARYMSRKYHGYIDKASEIEKGGLGFYPIWVCWWQGEQMMPLVPKLCLKQLKKNVNNSQRIVVLSEKNYRDYVDLPSYVIEKLNKGKISITNFSDVLRYALLTKYGGLWIDSTCYTTANLPDLNNIPYYTSKQRKHDDATYISRYRWASYLMGGMSNQIFVNERNLFFEYLEKENRFVDYLLVDYFLNLIYSQSGTCREMMDKCPYYNENILEMASNLNDAYNDTLWNTILSMDTIHKLSWKLRYDMYDKNTGGMTVFGKIVDLA